MEVIFIAKDESVLDWVKRIQPATQVSDGFLAREFIKIFNKYSEVKSYLTAISIRKELRELVADLYDLIEFPNDLSIKELDKWETAFFPEGFNFKKYCHDCLFLKEKCICSA